MEIREFLGLNSSRLNADILADRMKEDPAVFDTVWNIMLEDSGKESMRAAWSLSLLAEKHPDRIKPRIPEITDKLPVIRSVSVRRSLLKMLTFLPLPEDQIGILFETCFDFVESPSSEIAHKAYSMIILYNISEIEPELKPELIALFESQIDHGSAGIRSRCITLIRRLQKDLSIQESDRAGN